MTSLAELVREAPLVTLTGVGGVGKTRLALQVAADLVPDFPDGAWLCDFAPITDPGAVWETLAASLRVHAYTGRSLEESVLDYLTAKRLLLVLDNCEHLIDPIARVAGVIAQRCPHVSLLATSREGLAVAGERMVAVRPLGVPVDDTDAASSSGADAVQLFSDRASAAKDDFVLSERNAAAVGVLCRRLDGIPLAIELAAARVRSLSPEDLVSRLDQRFRLLTGGSRAALERHQTLRSTIDWSYDLLGSTEQQALNRLSVFAGGCDLRAAEVVLSGHDLDVWDIADTLGHLVDKSLVIADGDRAGKVRYRLLETIRQYARERLEATGDTARVRRRHADHYVEVAEVAGPHLRAPISCPGPQLWRATSTTSEWRSTGRSKPGHPNRPAAWSRPSPCRAWPWRTPRWSGPSRPPRSQAWRTILASQRSPPGRHGARSWQTTSIGRVPWWPPPTGRCADRRRSPCYGQGRSSPTSPGTSTRQPGLRRCGRPRRGRQLTGTSSATRSPCSAGPGTSRRRRRRSSSSEKRCRSPEAGGVPSSIAITLSGCAGSLPLEEADRAVELLDEAIEVGTEVGDHMAVDLARLNKGMIAARRGDWRTALRLAADTARQQLDVGDLSGLPGSLGLAASAFSMVSRHEVAAVLIGRAGSMSPMDAFVGFGMDAETEMVRDALGDEELAKLEERGATQDLRTVVDYLCSEAELLLAGA